MNVSVSLCEQGLVEFKMPFRKEQVQVGGKYAKDLKDAEDKAKQRKVGLFSGKEHPLQRFQDCTGKSHLARNTWELLQQNKGQYLSAMVEAVISGSKLKVRLEKQTCYIMLLLQGLKCLPHDSNVQEYFTFSNLALKYTKRNLLQREVQV